MKSLIKNVLTGLTLMSVAPLALASGGVDGGGGGTLPANPASTYEIYEIVTEAKRELRLFARYQSSLYPKLYSDSSLHKKLFGGEKTLLDVIEETEMDLRMDRPCYDANGVEYDGSAHSDRPGAICISAFRIAPKLESGFARIQTLALIGHELAHVLGADEKEATEFQKIMVLALKETSEESALEMARQSHMGVDAVETGFRGLLHEMDTVSDDVLARKVGDLANFTFRFHLHDYQQPYSPLSGEEQDFFRVLEGRYTVGFWYLLSQGENGHRWKERLERLFGGNETVTYDQFQKVHFGDEKLQRYGHLPVKRIRDRKELKALIVEIARSLGELNFRMEAIEWNSRLPSIAGPWVESNQENPWFNFVGKYRVDNSFCDNSNGDFQPTPFTAIEIYARFPGARGLVLKKISRSGSGEFFLHTGAGIGGYAESQVAGSSDEAYVTASDGDRWGPRSSSYSLRFKQSAADGPTLVERFTYTSRSPRGVVDTVHECVFRLKKL